MYDAVVSQNKAAWEYRAYEWRVSHQGTPQAVAAKMMGNPQKSLRYHGAYFSDAAGKRVASICGSDGRRAVALALLKADAVVFDISEPQKEYAMALAQAAGVEIGYEIGDFCKTDIARYGAYFDYAYAEGGVLHYFHDLERFFETVYAILKPNGALLLCDFHPFTKIVSANFTAEVEGEADYFNSGAINDCVAYKPFFAKDEQASFPDVSVRRYTISEILNASIRAGLTIREFVEHPGWVNPKWPGEFTIVAAK